MEDKAKITKALLPVLRMTRNLDDLLDLEYHKPGGSFEFVVATFENGKKKHANVTGDSGTAMIQDIISQLV